MAATARYTAGGHLIEFRTMQVRSILNRSVSKRQLSLAYSINPYRGCEFGCKYCYARYTHGFLAPADEHVDVTQPTCRPSEALIDTADLRDPESFERRIFIKQNSAWLLEQELRKINAADEIAIGTATDPYQPIEKRVRMTRAILEVFTRRSGYRIGIVTKSHLIERDIDLLKSIAQHNTLVVHLTITTVDAALARLLEPRAPRPDLRFKAVKTLRGAGITTGILCSPLLPGITDTADSLDQMAQQAAAAGASFFAAQPLFLKSCSRPTYLSFVREHFPALEAEYAKRFAQRDFAAPEYRRKLASMVTVACHRYGLSQRSSDALLTRDVGATRRQVESSGRETQQRLFG